jgi:hypothetical protein
MQKEMDKIQFEYRSEVTEILEALQTYNKEHNASNSVKELIALLDVLEMEW